MVIAEMKAMRTIFVVLLLSSQIALAQAKPEVRPANGAPIEVAPEVAPEVVPIDKEPSHHLVFENEYVRVFRVEVAPHSETKYHQHDRDYVWVALGDSDVESERLQGSYVGWLPTAPIHITAKDGDVQFTKGGFAHKAVNRSDKPFRNVTVELKKGAGESAVACSSGNCTRYLTYQLKPIGLERRLFFGRGDAISYELSKAGAELRVPYIITHGETSVLLIPVTQITVAIDSTPPTRREAGEIVWAEHSPEVMVRNESTSKWVVLKFRGPETQGPSAKRGPQDDKAK